MSEIALLITHKAKPGQRDALKAIWMRHMAPAIDANPNHTAYVYSFDPSDPDTVCAFQLYSSPEAAQEFLKHPSYLAYLKESRPLLASEPQIRMLDPQWIKKA
jgi:quinol monooxygenase YgiN